jgi:trehalose 6-phosphate phosphatase
VASRAGAPAPDIAAECALFLDVDGTLLELAPTPDATIVPAGLKELLASLQETAGGALALVSGRSLEQLDGLFAPLRLPAAGLHGLERRSATGARQDAVAPREIPQAARDHLLQAVSRQPGLLLEDKGATLALHYRLVPELQEIARQAMETVREYAGTAYTLLNGKMVIELKPTDASKCKAIAAFMREQPFAGRVPIFVGDDDTDGAGFEYVNGVGGVSIQIGETPWRGATYHLADVPAMHAWLASLLRFPAQASKP